MGKKLCIRNLHASVDASTLEDMFETVGNVQSASVSCDVETGTSLGYGHIEMSTEQEAADCIDRFNGQEKNGRILIVIEDKPHVPNLAFTAKRRKPAAMKRKAKA